MNAIQEDAKNDKLIILKKLNQIQKFLNILYNMNNIIINKKNIL